MGCHFLLQCIKVKSESEVAQLCPILRDPMDCSLPGSSIHGIFQARVLEWGAIAVTVLLIGSRDWWLSSEESTCQCRRQAFSPWVGKIPWRRKWQPTPVFLSEESHGQRSLAGYSPRGLKKSDMTERLKQQACYCEHNIDLWMFVILHN